MPTVRSGDASIAYEVTGDGEPLLLIMGLGADSRMWVLQRTAFAQHYRVITFDNRGVGASSSPPGPWSVEQMAADALAVLDAAGAASAHVVGISLGGAIAQQIALAAPDRVRSLVLAATWARRNDYLERMTEVGLSIADGFGVEALVRASILWLLSPATILSMPAAVAQLEQVVLGMQPPVEAFRMQVASIAGHDVLERLPDVGVPTLVLCGARDILVPPELSREIADALPKATLTELDAGHALNFEKADEFNAAILAFLGTGPA